MRQENSTFRILFVDDSTDNLILFQTILESEGYSVELADSGEAALTQVLADPPDLIFLDVKMPNMSGPEVIQRIRDNPTLPFIPIIFLTGDEQAKEAQDGDFEVNDFLNKPVDINQLLTVVKKYRK